MTDTWTWATVTQATPLRVKVDGDTSALDATTDNLVGSLAVSDRVRVHLHSDGIIVIGRSGGAGTFVAPAPTGVLATDTANIQATIDAATAAAPGVIVTFSKSATAYAMGAVTIGPVSGLSIVGREANITLTGLRAGFSLASGCSDVTVEGIHAVGDGASASLQSLIGSVSGGSTLTRVTVKDNYVDHTNIGISMSGPLSDVKILNNVITRSVGTTPGHGYGIHVGGNTGTKVNGLIRGNLITDCGRHGIYVARGDDITVSGNIIRDHRATEGDGVNVRAAINSARGSRRIIAHNIVENAKDGGLLVGQGSIAGEDCYDTIVSGNIFANPANALPTITIGSSTADPTIFLSRLAIKDNHFTSTQNATLIVFWCGKDVSIVGNTAYLSSGTSTRFLAIQAVGETAGTTINTDHLYVALNRVAATGGYFVRFNGTPAVTAGYTLRCVANTVTGQVATWSMSAAANGPIVECIDTPMDGAAWTGGAGFAGSLQIGGALGVGNSVAATTPGSVVKKIEVFNQVGVSLGFVPVYSTIT